jgi:predicted transcriptional regulator
MNGLTKTTLYLRESDYRKLKNLARRQKRSAAELVRTAVAEYAARHEGSRIPKSVGAGRSGRGDLSERAEELLGGMGKS